MTSIRTLAILAALGTATPALAEGDVAKGEKLYKKCKACHMIVNGDEVIFKGGKTGPNLYGIIGSAAGAVEGFRYGKSLTAAGEAGLVWDEELLAKYVADPKVFLREYLDDDSAKSSMSFRLKKGGEDMAAYLASVSPAMEMEATEGEATEAEAEASY
ncbi:MAG: cytochrome C [Marinosulfonomonas sp.]|nr:MAG: cytochrome C [Marinosulfonomonas sp.]